MRYYFVSFWWDKEFRNNLITTHPLQWQVAERMAGNNMQIIAYQEISEEEYSQFEEDTNA